MFDFLRERGLTAEEKRLEALGAYLDNALTAAERERFEGQLARDASLREEMERMRALKLQMRAMPRRRVPRSFALDPAIYAKPKAQPLMQLYPVLRGATAMTAFFLIFTLALGMFRGQFGGGDMVASQAVTESVVEEEMGAFEAAESEPLAAPATADEQERAIPTTPAEEPSIAELSGQEAITDTFSTEMLPSAEGTAVPEGDLGGGGAQDAPVEEAAEEIADAGESALNPSTAGEPEVPFVKEPTSETGDQATPTGNTIDSLLLPLQIALAILFILLMALWLIARRRARSF